MKKKEDVSMGILVKGEQRMTDCNKCKEYDKEKNYCPVFCNVINDTLTDRTIYELEDIKAEMESRVKLNNDLENYDIATGLSIALGILDKHIYELEGDSK